MFPFMRTFAIIEILLVNVYSTRKYLVEVGNERSEEGRGYKTEFRSRHGRWPPVQGGI